MIGKVFLEYSFLLIYKSTLRIHYQGYCQPGGAAFQGAVPANEKILLQ